MTAQPEPPHYSTTSMHAASFYFYYWPVKLLQSGLIHSILISEQPCRIGVLSPFSFHPSTSSSQQHTTTHRTQYQICVTTDDVRLGSSVTSPSPFSTHLVCFSCGLRILSHSLPLCCCIHLSSVQRWVMHQPVNHEYVPPEPSHAQKPTATTHTSHYYNATRKRAKMRTSIIPHIRTIKMRKTTHTPPPHPPSPAPHSRTPTPSAYDARLTRGHCHCKG